MHALFDSFVNFLVSFISEIGYLGIFLGMFLESTLVPIPSELIMIPAGIAAASGAINLYFAIIIGTVGNVFGAIFSYYLADLIGRPLLLKIGKYFFVYEQTIVKIEKFFEKHGSVSIFIGRLLPGFRHFISLPAGIAKMNIKTFIIYTSLGSTIWTSVLAILGFTIKENQQLIKENLHTIALISFGFCAIIIIFHILLKPARK
jgi:membrane protein DedA with SNARE-associated domain